jgi:hypothetical protein
VSKARKVDLRLTPWGKKGFGDLAEWFARLQRPPPPPRAAAIRLLQGLDPALQLDRVGACLVLFARDQNGFEAVRSACLSQSSSGPTACETLSVRMDATHNHGTRPWHKSLNPACADLPVQMCVTADTNLLSKTKPIIRCMTCGQQDQLSKIQWRDQLQKLKNSEGDDTDLVIRLNQLHRMAPALVECIDMRVPDGNLAIWQERVGPHLAYTWEKVPQLVDCVRTVSVSCKVKWDETPLDVGVAMGRRALNYMNIPKMLELATKASAGRRAGKSHGSSFALGWPNHAEDSMTVTSAYDLSVPLAILHLARQTATEVVHLKHTVAQQDIRIDRLERMLAVEPLPIQVDPNKRTTSQIRHLARVRPDVDQQNSTRVDQHDDDDDDEDDYSHPLRVPAVARAHPVVAVSTILLSETSSRPEKYTVDHDLCCLLMNGTQCLPLVAKVLGPYLPGGTLPSKPRTMALLKRIKRALKRQNEEKLGVFADWHRSRCNITSMFGTKQIAPSAAVYALDVLQRVVAHEADGERDA